MKCEICKTIARLGLDESAHDLWYCADGRVQKVTARRDRPEQVTRALFAYLLLKWRHRRQWTQAHLKPRLVTLGI